MAMLLREIVGKNSQNIVRLCASRVTLPSVTQVCRSKSSSTGFQDEVTHTGQKFEEGDTSLMRFEITGRKKLVNPRWAIDLVAETEPISCSSRVTSCDGGGGPLGHPKVYINLDQPGNHICGYCGLQFFQEHEHH